MASIQIHKHQWNNNLPQGSCCGSSASFRSGFGLIVSDCPKTINSDFSSFDYFKSLSNEDLNKVEHRTFS